MCTYVYDSLHTTTVEECIKLIMNMFGTKAAALYVWLLLFFIIALLIVGLIYLQFQIDPYSIIIHQVKPHWMLKYRYKLYSSLFCNYYITYTFSWKLLMKQLILIQDFGGSWKMAVVISISIRSEGVHQATMEWGCTYTWVMGVFRSSFNPTNFVCRKYKTIC